MGTTPAGIPYPEPGDPLASYPALAKILAMALPGAFQIGSVSITPSGAGVNTGGAPVVYDTPFASAARIFFAFNTGPGTAATDNVFAWASSNAPTGFAPWLKRSTVQATTIWWLAIGPRAT